MEFTVFLDASDKVPLFNQVYDQIRKAIISVRLRSGEKLPSTRELSSRLKVSRNTINAAYERLVSEGYLEARRGSGTYVASVAASFHGKARVKGATPIGYEIPSALRELENRICATVSVDLPYDFRPGTPNLDDFPTTSWRRVVARHLRRLSPELGKYSDPAGFLPLREVICDYLKRSRAVACDVEQVIVTTGSQQTLYLLGQLFLPKGRAVLENPCYPAAAAVFRAVGGRIVPVDLDNNGIRVIKIPRGSALIYVTPSHQYPTGIVMPLQRRLALLDRAREFEAIIVEDDYDSEFRYEGRSVESLQSLDESGIVVYIGSFSNVMFPTLRLGYAVIPHWLVKPFLAQKWITDRLTSGLEQRFLADFILQGYFDKYLRRVRKIYAERRRVLTECLARYADRYLEVVPSVAGLHITTWLKDATNPEFLKTRAAKAGVGVYPLTPYYLKNPRPGLIFGYSALCVDGIREGMQRIGQILTSWNLKN